MLDANGRPTGIKLVREVHTPNPPQEIDVFPLSLAQVTLALPNGQTESVTLSGPTKVVVNIPPTGLATDTDGNGRDQVATEMVQLDLKGTSSLGAVSVTLDPAHQTLGQIEEQVNNTPGVLDVPPFAATGKADSFFDVWFQIQVGNQVLHAAQSAHMQAVITHKPPAPGDEYVNPFTQPIDLLDANGRPTGIKLVREVHTPNPIEVDHFEKSIGQFTLSIPGLGDREVLVSGPTTVQVYVGTQGEASDHDGNGRDDVQTVMTQLDLSGTDAKLGLIKVRLRDAAKHPNQPSTGRIEEVVNTQFSRLDVPPFAPTGLAESVFDLYFEIEVGGKLYHNIVPKHMLSVIDHKPPGPGTTYYYPQIIDLYDEQDLPTGVKLLRASHTPNPPLPEIDFFENSTARFTIEVAGLGQRDITLSGPSTVHVWVGPNGEASDRNGNGLDDVLTQMVQLDLTGMDPDLGEVKLHLRPPSQQPNQLSLGRIEETANTQAGRLDLPPFAPTGTANSFFDIFFEIEIPRLGLILHNIQPKRMQSIISHKPPQLGALYEDPQVIDLFTENNQPAGVRILKSGHTPNPPEVDDFPISVAQITLQYPNGQSENVVLSGPTRVIVNIPPDGAANDANGDGLDQVSTTMVNLDLRGASSQGAVRVTLNPSRTSQGEIQELVNNTPGKLDVPPFTPTGQANSFFDVWFQIQVGTQAFFAAQSVHMQSVISHKPPGEGDIYLSPTQAIDLLDATGNRTGVRIVHAAHRPNPPPEVDEFHFSQAQITLQYPSGQSENVLLAGPTRVAVNILPSGAATDSDGNGLDQVATEMVMLDLAGSTSQGAVHLTLNPAHQTIGQIEERANNTPGVLDLPPFTATGTANSFFDVWFQVELGGQIFLTTRPVHMTGVITHKPPGEGDLYGSPNDPIDLVDTQGRPTGIKLIHAQHVPNRPQEVDHFVFSHAQITLQLPGGRSENLSLSGPTTVVVDVPPNGAASDTDGDGRDQVHTAMTELSLTGPSSLGPVEVRLNPARLSTGGIEERANNTPGTLDLPPFRPIGTADSFFDVWFQVQVGPLIFNAARPVHMQSVITHKPPAQDDLYASPNEPIDLLDLQGNPTGIRLVHAFHQPTPPQEIDDFPISSAQFTLQYPGGLSENVVLTGPTRVIVDIAATGAATDPNGNGLDEVATTMVNLDLRGTSSQGAVRVSLNPDRPTLGLIEERVNTTPGALDLPPFRPAGTANSFFDVWFRVEVGGRVFYAARPVHMQSIISHKPPGPSDQYLSESVPIELLDPNGLPTGIRLIHATHRPNGPPQAPVLNIRRSLDNGITLSWIDTTATFLLQSAPSVSGPWSQVTGFTPTPSTEGQQSFTVRVAGAAQFYRLIK